MMVFDQRIKHHLSGPAAHSDERYLRLEVHHPFKDAGHSSNLRPSICCIIGVAQARLPLAVIPHSPCLENRWQPSNFQCLLKIFQAIDWREGRCTDATLMKELLLQQTILRNPHSTRIGIQVQALQNIRVDVLTLDRHDIHARRESSNGGSVVQVNRDDLGNLLCAVPRLPCTNHVDIQRLAQLAPASARVDQRPVSRFLVSLEWSFPWIGPLQHSLRLCTAKLFQLLRNPCIG